MRDARVRGITPVGLIPAPASTIETHHYRRRRTHGRNDIQWEDHHTLLETLQANGVPVLATCGGNASCATCHAFIDPEHYAASGERTEAEQDLLDMVDDVANEYSRLCCQVEYAPGMDGAEIQMQAAM